MYKRAVYFSMSFIFTNLMVYAIWLWRFSLLERTSSSQIEIGIGKNKMGMDCNHTQIRLPKILIAHYKSLMHNSYLAQKILSVFGSMPFSTQ